MPGYILPGKRYMLPFKWNYRPTFTTIFLKMCKLLSELINRTVHTTKNQGKVEAER
jgi:hypothetical protein